MAGPLGRLAAAVTRWRLGPPQEPEGVRVALRAGGGFVAWHRCDLAYVGVVGGVHEWEVVLPGPIRADEITEVEIQVLPQRTSVVLPVQVPAYPEEEP